MIGRKFTSLLAATGVSLGVACVVLLVGAGSALACMVDGDGDCFRPNYHIQRTDGSLAAWSGPGTGRIVDQLGGNGTPVEVVCETTGPTEDGLPYVVWDQLDDGTYVYGYYLDTPGDGYHPALTPCSGSGAGPKPPSPPSPPPGGGTTANRFNAAGAAAWARANAMSSANPYGFGDDCTDFVSRAMHLGGGMLEQIVQGVLPWNHTDDHNWYEYQLFGRWIGTYSWGAAPHLANFLRITGRSQQVSLQAAGPGDLIFVNWGSHGRDLPAGQTEMSGPGGIDHVGMVVGNPGSRGGYDIQIAQHSPGRIEKLSDWTRPNPNLHFWIYHIHYS
jgi:Putative amidase domain